MKAITKTIIASAMLSSTILFTSCVSEEKKQEQEQKKFQEQLRTINNYEYGMATWNTVDEVTFIDHTNNDQIITVPKYNTNLMFTFNENESTLLDLRSQTGSLDPNKVTETTGGTKFFHGIHNNKYVKIGKVNDYQLNVNYEGTTEISYPHLQGHGRVQVPIKVTGTVKFLNFNDDPNIYNNARIEANLRYTTTTDSLTVTRLVKNLDNITYTTTYFKIKDHRDFTQRFIARP